MPGSPKWSLPFRFSSKIPHVFLLSPMRTTRPAHLILLAITTLIVLGVQYYLRSSSLCSFLQPPVTSPLLAPNILHSALFSNTLSKCSSLTVKEQTPHSYITISKIKNFPRFHY
jgi:hypothetical protein